MKVFITKACVILILICGNSQIINSQQIKPIITYAEYLEDNGNDRAALKEYLRAYYHDRDNQHPDLALKVSYLFLNASNYGSALQFVNNYLHNDDLTGEEKFDAFIYKSRILLESNLPQEAQLSLYSIPNELRTLDRDRYNYYLGITKLFSGQSNKAISHFSDLSYVDDEELVELRKYCEKLEKVQSKKHNKAVFLSTILPGLGQTINGEYRDGANSILLTGSLVYVLLEVAKRLTFVDSLVSVGPWLMRYYIGGLQNAKLASINKMKRQQSSLMLQLNSFLETCK